MPATREVNVYRRRCLHRVLRIPKLGPHLPGTCSRTDYRALFRQQAGSAREREHRELTGLRPSPTSHAVVDFRFSGRLTQGPAVRATDRRHPLRLDMLTSTRSAYVQVRCAVVALWSGHHRRYAHQIRPASTKLDSFLPTSSDIAWLGEVCERIRAFHAAHHGRHR
jgi:hypothetical protein